MDEINLLTTVEPWKKQNKIVSELELNKSLSLLGFGAWTSLEPSKHYFKRFVY